MRQLSRADDVRTAIGVAVGADGAAAERLSFHEADLLKDAGWTEAAAGAGYVLHVASPMPLGEYRGQDVITPAREGTRRVLEAAHAGGARRVVITSSSAAAIPRDRDSVADETVWSELPDEARYNYSRSKTSPSRTPGGSRSPPASSCPPFCPAASWVPSWAVTTRPR